jgi:small subunit ribosomal protein S8
MARILMEQGFIKKYIIIDDGKQGLIRIWLKYDEENNPVITHLERVSTPGRRIYVDVDNLPRVMNNLGIAIVTTSKGVLTAREARRQNVGGEVLCYIW